jgi:hypothetical protein
MAVIASSPATCGAPTTMVGSSVARDATPTVASNPTARGAATTMVVMADSPVTRGTATTMAACR